jgi:hypothetical protein
MAFIESSAPGDQALGRRRLALRDSARRATPRAAELPRRRLKPALLAIAGWQSGVGVAIRAQVQLVGLKGPRRRRRKDSNYVFSTERICESC